MSFLAVVIDPFSRRVVGWSMQPDMPRSLVIDALEMAWFLRRPDRKAGLIFHADRGSQYASDEFNKVLKELRHHAVDELQGKLLGQCLLGEAVRLAEGGTAARPAL